MGEGKKERKMEKWGSFFTFCIERATLRLRGCLPGKHPSNEPVLGRLVDSLLARRGFLSLSELEAISWGGLDGFVLAGVTRTRLGDGS